MPALSVTFSSSVRKLPKALRREHVPVRADDVRWIEAVDRTQRDHEELRQREARTRLRIWSGPVSSWFQIM